MAAPLRSGQNHHNAKLTDRDVDLIFTLKATGMRVEEIAKKMECSMRHIYYVLKGQRRGLVAYS